MMIVVVVLAMLVCCLFWYRSSQKKDMDLHTIQSEDTSLLDTPEFNLNWE